ncbi:MAG: YitT family protein [Candidatus Avilachnospira sp.]|jgi:uncharacterized membrane-anchored protein YitT (DUF2179 family)
MLDNFKRRSVFKEYFLIILGSFVMGYAIKNILDPVNLVTGGVSGFAVIFNGLWSVPLWITNTALNIPLFIITYIIKGKNFMIKTIVATTALSVALAVIPEHSIINDGDILLSAIFGGIVMGVGTGLVFMNRATTGGTDMMAADIQHFMRHKSVAQILMVLDGMVVLLGAGIFGINKALYAVISVFLVIAISDRIIDGLKFGKVLYIISDKSTEIADRIMAEMERGVTAIKAKGMYTGNDKQMLYVVVQSREVPQVKDIIYEVDRDAFLILSNATEVVGEGFIEREDA